MSSCVSGRNTNTTQQLLQSTWAEPQNLSVVELQLRFGPNSQLKALPVLETWPFMTPLVSLNQCKFQTQRCDTDIYKQTMVCKQCYRHAIKWPGLIIQKKRKRPHVMGEVVSKDSGVIPAFHPTPPLREFGSIIAVLLFVCLFWVCVCVCIRTRTRWFAAQMEDHLQGRKVPNLSGSEHGGFEGQFGMLPVLD